LGKGERGKNGLGKVGKKEKNTTHTVLGSEVKENGTLTTTKDKDRTKKRNTQKKKKKPTQPKTPKRRTGGKQAEVGDSCLDAVGNRLDQSCIWGGEKKKGAGKCQD